jgi:hypothetical protein
VRKAFALLLVLATTPACVERKLVIRSDPEDALVFVDGTEVVRKKGEPPTLRYEHYGIRKVVVRKQGFVAHDELVTLDPPWYQLSPLDLFFDVLWPATIEDTREVLVKLDRRQDLEDPKAGDAVFERARALEVEATEGHK